MIEKYEVVGDSGNRYIVSYDKKRNLWLCSCPRFIYQRKKLEEKEPCKHILYVQSLSQEDKEKLKKGVYVNRLEALRKNGFVILGFVYNYVWKAEEEKKEMRLRAERLKQNGKIERWMSINEGDIYYLLIKPKYDWYEERVKEFEDELNNAFDEIKNANSVYLKSRTLFGVRTIFTEYDHLKDEYEELVQLVLYNKSGEINKNISTEEFNHLNNRLLKLDKKLDELKKLVKEKDERYTPKVIEGLKECIRENIGLARRLMVEYRNSLIGSKYYKEIMNFEKNLEN